METASPPKTKQDVFERLYAELEEDYERWRFESLYKAGWDPSRAEVIAKRHDIDLHYACDLVKKHGCPSEIAAMILL